MCLNLFDKAREGIIDIEQIDSIITKKHDDLISALDNSLSQAITTYEKLQASKKKGPLIYIYISWLRSSARLDSPLMRIDMYDQKGYKDLEECYVRWDIDCVINEIHLPYRDFVHKDYPTPLTEYENEKGWLGIVEKICFEFEKHITHMLDSTSAVESFSQVKIYCGEFMDRVVKVR